MVPQGIISFTGILQVLHGSATAAHGVSPSTATLYVAPQTGQLPRAGTLTISYPGGAYIRWRDCRVMSMTSEIDESGKEIWVLNIQDRRWKWQGLGAISGCYNQKSADTDLLFVPGTEKNPRELATLCLRALGDSGNVSALPAQARPEIEWDYEDPATALSSLCEQFGCHVTLDLNNRVNIVRLGSGASLPNGSSVLSDSITVDPPERPDEIRIATARVRCQVDLPLEAVGIDIDGQLKPIDDLTYAPRSGNWNTIDVRHFNNIKDQRVREFAKQSVFRYYRIKTPFQIPAIDRNGQQTINELSRILPLETNQLDTAKDTSGNTNVEKPLPAWVYGVYASPGDGMSNVIEARQVDPNRVADKKNSTGFCAEAFTIDADRGLVIFKEPVWSVEKARGTNGIIGAHIKPAILALRTTVSVRDPRTYAWTRYERGQPVRGTRSGTPPRVEIKDEMGLVVKARYNRALRIVRQEDNHREVDRFADYYLDALSKEYRAKQPTTRTYAGFLPIELGGKILQVTWIWGEDGSAKTQASSDIEMALVAVPYQEARDLRTIKQLRDQRQKPPASRQIEKAQSQRVRT